MTQRNYGVWKNIIYVCLWRVNPCRLIKFRTSLKFRSNQNSLHTLYRTLWNKLSLKDENNAEKKVTLSNVEFDLRLIHCNNFDFNFRGKLDTASATVNFPR